MIFHASLTSLPLELLAKISDEVAKADLKALRLTCKTFAEVLEDRVLQSVVIDLDNTNIERNVVKMRSLASSKQDKALNAVKELALLGLDPYFHPRQEKKSVRSESDGQWITTIEYPEDYDKEAAAQAEQIEKDCLALAISSLENLSVIRCHPTKGTPDWVVQAMMETLSTVGHKIKSLDLAVASWEQTSIVFLSFTWPFLNVQHLRLGLPRYKSDGSVLAQVTGPIATIIQTSSELESLKIDGDNQPIDLHQAGVGGAVGSLNSLSFTSDLGYTIRLPFDLGSAFRGLTSLEIDDTSNRPINVGRRSVPKSRGPEVNGKDIWGVFKEMGYVRLHKLKATPITDSLLDYLSSYSGVLTELELVNDYTDSGEQSDRLARKFFQGVLPKHRPILIRLSLVACYEGEWCITGEKLKTDLAGCVRLRHLTISFLEKDIKDTQTSQPGSVTSMPGSNIIHTVLDSYTQDRQFPSLQSVCFTSAALESHRGAPRRTSYFMRYRWLLKSVPNLIEKYARRRNSQKVPLSLVGQNLATVQIKSQRKEWTLVKELGAGYVTWRCVERPSE